MDIAVHYPHSPGILPHHRPKIATASVPNCWTSVTFWVDWIFFTSANSNRFIRPPKARQHGVPLQGLYRLAFPQSSHLEPCRHQQYSPLSADLLPSATAG